MVHFHKKKLNLWPVNINFCSYALFIRTIFFVIVFFQKNAFLICINVINSFFLQKLYWIVMDFMDLFEIETSNCLGEFERSALQLLWQLFHQTKFGVYSKRLKNEMMCSIHIIVDTLQKRLILFSNFLMFYIIPVSSHCQVLQFSLMSFVHYRAFLRFYNFKVFPNSCKKDCGDKGRFGNTEEKYNCVIFWGQYSSRPTSTTLSVSNYIMCMVSCNLYFQWHERLNSSHIFMIHLSVIACVINHRYEKKLSVVTFAVALVGL